MRPERLVEVVVLRAGERHRGSGYRVTSRTVLTARHVVAGAEHVEVRFDAGLPTARTVPALMAYADAGADLALLTWPADDRIEPQPLGRIGAAPAVLPVQIAGFPRWKLRRGRFRDSAVEPGTAAVLANRREGTLQITVAPPADDPDGRTPWEGISGGPVFAGGRLIAVVSEHHRREGLNRLTASPVARWVDRLAGEQRAGVLAGLGLDGAGTMADVAAPASAYPARVHDLAPPEALVDRESELDALTRFCAGEEAYAWWQAPPWAGKTALMSTFVLQPPAGVRVVSFFIRGRHAGQADSTAFTDALLDQLAALLGRELPPTAGPSVRDALRRQLLVAAAEQAAASGQRLVLVVDGLDEDTGTGPGSAVPSIASLLPPRPGPELKVIVAGRPHPPIPGDVPGHHPLRRCPVVELTPSPWAGDIARAALRELGAHLVAGGLRRDLVAMLAAAGGGLTLDDLVALTGSPPYEVDDLLGGDFGRTLERRDAAYLFAHDALRELALERLGRVQLDRRRERLHAWAALHRDRGWPRDTPGYLLRGYFGLLRDLRDLPRLVAVATDPVRHDRMLSRLHTDTAALAEIAAAHRLAAAEPRADLVAVGRLAVHRDFLTHRNLTISADIPALWGRLGRPARADALAESITDPARRSEALRRLAEQAAAGRDWPRALRLLRTTPSAEARIAATATALAAAGDKPVHALLDQVLAAVGMLPEGHGRRSALVELATPLVRAGDREGLERVVRWHTTPDRQASMIEALTEECRTPGARIDVADLVAIGTRIIRSGVAGEEREAALSTLTGLLPARTSARLAVRLPVEPAETWADGAEEWDDEDEDEPSGTTGEMSTAEESVSLAEASWAAGEHAASRTRLSETVAAIGVRWAGDPALPGRIAALALRQGGIGHAVDVGCAVADRVRLSWDKEGDGTVPLGTGFRILCALPPLVTGDPEAQEAALDAAASRIGAFTGRARLYVRVARAIGKLDRAIEATWRGRNAPYWLDLRALAQGLAEEDQFGEAAAVVARIAEEHRASVLAGLVSIALRRGAFTAALDLAGRLPDPHERAANLVAVAAAVADDGRLDVARDIAEQAEVTARSAPDVPWQLAVAGELAALTAATGDAATAAALVGAAGRIGATTADGNRLLEPIVGLIGEAADTADRPLLRLLGSLALVVGRESDDPDHHGELVARLARVAAAEGDDDRARMLLAAADRLIDAVPGPDRRDWALAELVWAASELGDFDRAERAAAATGNPDRRAVAQIDLVRATAAAGHVRRARGAAMRITVPGGRADALLEVVRVLVASRDWEQAVAVAGTIEIADARSAGLLLVSQAAARAGEPDRARDIAWTIPGPAWRERALQCAVAASPDRPAPATTPPRIADRAGDLVPAAALRRLSELTHPASPAPDPGEIAASFLATDCRRPLAGLLWHAPEVIAAVAAETLVLIGGPIPTPAHRDAGHAPA